jgi:hypothetical protein
MIDQKTQNKLNKTVYDIALAKLPERIDDFTKWFMTGVGAALTLLLTNAAQITSEIPATYFKLTLALLALSLVFGFVARAMCTVIVVVRDVQQQLAGEMEAIFGLKHDDTLSPRVALDAKGADAALEITRQMSKPMFPHVRYFAMRAAKKAIADTSGQDRVSIGLTKASQWQANIALLSFVLAIAGAAIAISGISRSTPTHSPATPTAASADHGRQK